MAGMIFRIETFFKGTDNFDQLVKIMKVLGQEDLIRYVDKYGLNIPKEVKRVMAHDFFPRIPWTNFTNDNNKHLHDADAIDLLDKMLKYDKNERIKPKDAMKHPYFDPIREFIRIQEANEDD